MPEEYLADLAAFALAHPMTSVVVLAFVAWSITSSQFGAADARRGRAAREDAAALLAEAQTAATDAAAALATAVELRAEAQSNLDFARANLSEAMSIIARQAAAFGVDEDDPIPDWATAWAALAWTSPAHAGKPVDSELAFDFARMLTEAAVAGPPAFLLTPKGGAS